VDARPLARVRPAFRPAVVVGIDGQTTQLLLDSALSEDADETDTDTVTARPTPSDDGETDAGELVHCFADDVIFEL